MTLVPHQKVPLWRDDRFWKVVFQAVIVIAVVGAYGFLLHSLNLNLARTGLQFSFSFLNHSASFSIGETLIPYNSQDKYTRALLVGFINSIRVIVVALGLTTIVGILAGIASFSENWLLRKLSLFYVEIVRNTPLLLQLLFWYFVVFLSFPNPSATLELPGSIFMNKNGIHLPWPVLNRSFGLWLLVLVVGAIVAVLVWRWGIKAQMERGASGQVQQVILIILGLAALAIVVIGFPWEAPQSSAPGRIQGGLRLSLEYCAVAMGLVFYTGAFIAEIVRGGIQSVSKGQWEAARSLGLQPGSMMRLVVFPQALRAIIPPMSSQYMNLAKNSSLAVSVGYPDLFSVASTTLNQTGRPLEVFLIIMSVYLTINLTISVIMNLLNRLVQIQER